MAAQAVSRSVVASRFGDVDASVIAIVLGAPRRLNSAQAAVLAARASERELGIAVTAARASLNAR